MKLGDSKAEKMRHSIEADGSVRQFDWNRRRNHALLAAPIRSFCVKSNSRV